MDLSPWREMSAPYFGSDYEDYKSGKAAASKAAAAAAKAKA